MNNTILFILLSFTTVSLLAMDRQPFSCRANFKRPIALDIADIPAKIIPDNFSRPKKTDPDQPIKSVRTRQREFLDQEALWMCIVRFYIKAPSIQCSIDNSLALRITGPIPQDLQAVIEVNRQHITILNDPSSLNTDPICLLSVNQDHLLLVRNTSNMHAFLMSILQTERSHIFTRQSK